MRSGTRSLRRTKSNIPHGQDDFCLQIMMETAGYLLSQDSSRKIFLDGRPFSRRYQIENVIAAAESLLQPWRILECSVRGNCSSAT